MNNWIQIKMAIGFDPINNQRLIGSVNGSGKVDIGKDIIPSDVKSSNENGRCPDLKYYDSFVFLSDLALCMKVIFNLLSEEDPLDTNDSIEIYIPELKSSN